MKRFTTICLAVIIMVMVVLTGCSTFAIDKVSYYNEVVAKVGEQNITRFDLVSAYSNYGYNQYVTQEGKEEKEALLSTLDVLVQRKLLVQYAKGNEDKYKLSEYEINSVMQSTLDGLKQSLSSNIATARKIYGVDEPVSSVKDEDEAKETKKISDYYYTHRVKVEDGKLVYIDTDTDEDIDDYALDEKYIKNFTDYTTTQIVKALQSKFIENLYYNENNEDNYSKICDKALDLTYNNLISYEYYLRDDNGKKYSQTKEDLLFRYVKRTYESQLESAYINKVNNVYLKEEQLSNDSVINAFKALYESDYAKYHNDVEAYNSKIISTGAGGDMIYYAPDSDSKFGYFLHVLLPLNNVEAELNWLKEHKDIMTDEEYQADQQRLLGEITCAERTIKDIYEDDKLVFEEGIVLKDQKSVKDVLNEYRANVNDLNSFVEFMFRYSTDTATLTADMPYVIGYNTVTNAEHTTMKDSFTKEAIRLMKENEVYTSADDYILTSYGIHLLYYVGPVENQIKYTDVSNLTVEKLNSAVLNRATGETYLDKVFDLVYPAGSNGMFTSNTKYSDFEKILVDSLYSVYPVTIYETKVKASNKI